MKGGIIQRDEYDRQLRVPAQDHARGNDPAEPRHHDIHQYEPRRQLVDRLHRFFTRRCLADQHKPTSSRDQIPERLAESCVIVNH
jgi:hypothetical protein